MWSVVLLSSAYALDAEAPPPTAPTEPDPYEVALRTWLEKDGEEEAASIAHDMARAERELPWSTGVMPVGDQAHVTLAEGDRWLGPEQASHVLEMWGNPPTELVGGLILPANAHLFGPSSWAVLVDYTDDGWIDDSDAAEIDYDDLLAEMKENTAADAVERRKAGLDGLTLAGWAEPPHYDAATKVLYWARELESDSGDSSLNYEVRVLGRGGVLSLNAVADMNDLEKIRPVMEQVRGAAAYVPGRTYADYQPGVDPAAAYGLAALVAGGALAGKAGLFKVLLAALIAGKKFVLLGAAAIAGVVGKLFGGRGKKTEAPPSPGT
jgi:uncharacterized membrane-anchored protein